jgi:hypothetical protein
MTRSIPQPCSTLLLASTDIFAGGKAGLIRCWDAEGVEQWDHQADDRVESIQLAIDAKPPFICAAAGAEVVRLDAATGKRRWKKKLEGSCDLVVVRPDGGLVVATSSIYDIEYNDFMESAAWRWNGEGKRIRLDRFDERPWHLSLHGKQKALLGIGRPRCGILVQDESGIQHHPIAEDDPITCGCSSGQESVIGHASGMIQRLKVGRSGIKATVLAAASESATAAVNINAESVVDGTEAGFIRMSTLAGSEIWGQQMDCACDHLCIGFEHESESTVWVATWDGSESCLISLNGKEGAELCRFTSSARITTLTSLEDRVAIGDASGTIHIIEADLFRRRLQELQASAPTQQADSEDILLDHHRRSSLQDRLRALRGD